MFNTAGPSVQIARQTARAEVVVGTSVGNAGALDVRAASGLQMLVPDGTTGQAVAVHVSDEINGDYYPLKDSAGDAVSITVAENEAHDLPEAVYASHFVKFVGATDSFTVIILAKG